MTFPATQSVHLPKEVRRSRETKVSCVYASAVCWFATTLAPAKVYSKVPLGNWGSLPPRIATSLEWCSTFPILTIKQVSNVWDDF